jgi:hypothetical protein
VNYAATGFLPANRGEEKRCPGASAEILTDIADVTQRMQAAGADLSGSAFVRARDAEAAAIEAVVQAGVQGGAAPSTVADARVAAVRAPRFWELPQPELQAPPTDSSLPRDPMPTSAIALKVVRLQMKLLL